MSCVIDDTITHGCNFGLTPMVIVNEMHKRKYIKLPSKLFLTKNERFIYIKKYEIANFLGEEFGFSRVGGVQGILVLLYNSKSIYHNIIEKVKEGVIKK